MEWHHYAFGAVANLVQLKIEKDEVSVFKVILDYDHRNNKQQPPENGGMVVGQILMTLFSL